MEDTLQGTGIPRRGTRATDATEAPGHGQGPQSELHDRNQEENARHGSGLAQVNNRVMREINGYVVNPYNRDDLIKNIEKEYQVYEELRSVRPVGCTDTVLSEDAKNVSKDKVREERLRFLAKKEQEKVQKRRAQEKAEGPDQYELKKMTARQEAEKLEKLKQERLRKEQEEALKHREEIRRKREEAVEAVKQAKREEEEKARREKELQEAEMLKSAAREFSQSTTGLRDAMRKKYANF
jgi:hypothetical protein